MRPRHQARVRALQALYEADLVGHPPEAALEALLEQEEEGEPLPTETVEYARHLIGGVVRNREAIDRLITQAAPTWPLRQMPTIDKSILRLAIFELLFDNGAVPTKVAINEAVELAKEFGSENSSKFVNGVLGTIASSHSKRP